MRRESMADELDRLMQTPGPDGDVIREEVRHAMDELEGVLRSRQLKAGQSATRSAQEEWSPEDRDPEVATVPSSNSGYDADVRDSGYDEEEYR